MDNVLKKLFPECKFDNTLESQLEKILEEQEEAVDALHNKGREQFLYELIDTMVATANCVYKVGYTPQEVNHAIAQVKHSLKTRGYLK